MVAVDKYSKIVTICYGTIYGLIIFLTSIYSAYDTYRMHGKSTNSLGCMDFIKLWGKDFWSKKKIFLAVIPHLVDQATDIGTIWTYYDSYQQNKASQWFFITGIFIIMFQRVVSSATIYFITRSWRSTLLQMVDLLMVKAIYINYYFNLKEPGNPQRYLSILEAVFESSPQIILSLGFILKSIGAGTTETVSPMIIISVFASLWSLASKVASDDKEIFDERKEKEWRSLDVKFKKSIICVRCNFQYILRVIFWRLLEISSRICIATLLWINCGGMAFFIVIFAEMIMCLIISIKNKKPEPMGNVMYISFSSTDKMTQLFWLYRITSSYIYLILITIFAVIPFETYKVEEHE
eukprot:60588_1